MNTKTKKCPLCNSCRIIKKGKENGLQRYLCKGCGKKFRNKRRKKNRLTQEIFNKFVFGKQTIREIKEEYSLNKKTIIGHLKNYQNKEKQHNVREIHLVVDATYFGKRKEGTSWGVILFRDKAKKENLWWKFVDQEKLTYYREGREYLENLGYSIKSVTSDGFLGLTRVFDNIPFQICQFHTKKTCIRYLTNNPQTEQGKVLLLYYI